MGSFKDIRRCITAARAGSQDDFGRLMDATRSYLMLVANEELDAVMLAKGGASDLVQETFLEAQRGFSTFRGESEAELRGWLRQILRNNIVTMRRRYRNARKRALEREVPLDTVIDLDTRELKVESRDPSPSDQAIASEQRALLKQAIARLPRPYAHVIVLRHRDGLPFPEISQRLGRTPQSTRKIWARAILMLRREIDRISKGT